MLKLAWLCGFLLLATNLYSQVDRGALTGTVRDSSGLGVPGASVAAVQDATGLQAGRDHLRSRNLRHPRTTRRDLHRDIRRSRVSRR